MTALRATAQAARAMRSCDPAASADDYPVAFAGVRGVPEAEMGTLVALATLCVQAAERLAGDVSPDSISLSCLTRPYEDRPDSGVLRFASLLAITSTSRTCSSSR